MLLRDGCRGYFTPLALDQEPDTFQATSMKHITLAVFTAFAFILTSCNKENTTIENRKDATQQALDQRKHDAEVGAREAKIQADAEADKKKAQIEADKEATQAQIEADKKKAAVQARADKAMVTATNRP
jgi:hypothetical protein